MKRTVFSAAVLLFIGLGTAVVGGPDPGEDEMAITGVSGGSAEATTGVGPDGKTYRAVVENTQNSCMTENISTGVEFGNFHENGDMTRVNFTGTVGTSNPCHELSLNVSEGEGDIYTIEIVEKSTLGENESCQFCTGAVEFRGSFEAGEEYRLKVFHEGEKIFEDSTEGYQPGEGQKGEGNQSSETGSETGFNLWGAISGFFSAFF
jgi:hypothetical protein